MDKPWGTEGSEEEEASNRREELKKSVWQVLTATSVMMVKDSLPSLWFTTVNLIHTVI